VEFCLSSAHAECPHFARHLLLSSQAAIDGVPPPSPDIVMAPTRLVIDPASATGARSALRPTRRPVVAALVLVVAGTGAIGFGAVDGVASLLGRPIAPMSDASRVLPAATATATATANPTATPTVTPSPTVSPVPSRTPGATPSPSAAPTLEPTPQTYIVQPGDTLRAIADRFGTTVAALQAANGIVDQNLIAAGQQLIIP
jgi:LysM repeat protein